jgi:hypothetical protein
MRPRQLLLAFAVSAATVPMLVDGGSAAPAPPDRRPPTRPTIDAQVRQTALRPVFTFGATDTRTSRAKIRFRCALDGATLKPCARIHQPSAGLAFGRHTMRARALDLAGNASRTATFSFTVVGTWDAGRDFERAPRPANPGRDRYGNSTWFYLRSGTPAHAPADYHLLPNFIVLAPEWEVWHSSAGHPHHTPGSSTGFSNDAIIMHPGHFNLGQNAVLGWRSPVAATIRVSAQLENHDLASPGCSVPDNGLLWSIDKGANSLRSGFLAPSGRTAEDLTVAVSTGEFVYVVINDAGDSNCDTAVVRLSIETT